jgi:hypothetical protein
VQKQLIARGMPFEALYFREQKGHEVDFMVELGARILGIECKSGATFASDAFAELDYFARSLSVDPLQKQLVPAVAYGGTDSHQRTAGAAVAWNEIAAWLDEYLD